MLIVCEREAGPSRLLLAQFELKSKIVSILRTTVVLFSMSRPVSRTRTNEFPISIVCLANAAIEMKMRGMSPSSMIVKVQLRSSKRVSIEADSSINVLRTTQVFVRGKSDSECLSRCQLVVHQRDSITNLFLEPLLLFILTLIARQ